MKVKGSPDSSAGEGSTCSAGDPSSVPGSGRSPGEGKGYPLQYSGLENSMNWGCKESDTAEQLSLFFFSNFIIPGAGVIAVKKIV